jgi:hypothetical protein
MPQTLPAAQLVLSLHVASSCCSTDATTASSDSGAFATPHPAIDSTVSIKNAISVGRVIGDSSCALRFAYSSAPSKYQTRRPHSFDDSFAVEAVTKVAESAPAKSDGERTATIGGDTCSTPPTPRAST